MRYLIVTDKNDDNTTYGPFEASELRDWLGRIFADERDIMEVCDTLVDGIEGGRDTSALETYLGIEVAETDDVHFGHELHAARDMLGLSTEQLARIVGVTRARTVKAWETRDEPVPYDVWCMVDDLLIEQERAVDTALSIVGEHPQADAVAMPYWADQADYDAHHYAHDGGLWSHENATSRIVASVLRTRGIDVTWTSGEGNVVPQQ